MQVEQRLDTALRKCGQSWTGSEIDGKLRMLLQIIENVYASFLFQLQTAHLDGINTIGIQREEPFLLKSVFRTMVAEKGALTI